MLETNWGKSMLWWFFAKLTSYGSGYVFSNLLADILVSTVLCILTSKVIFPALKSYRSSKQLDRLFGTSPKHWLYGHAKKYNFTSQGIFNFSRIYLEFPRTFNAWVGPLLSVVYTYHPDITIKVLGCAAPKNEFIYRFLRPVLGDGLVTAKGKKWHRNRRLLTPAFHYKILQQYTEKFNSCVHILIEKWKNEVGNAVEVSEPFRLLTLDTMMQCAMSKITGFQCMSGKHPYIDALNVISSIAFKRIRTPYYYLDWIFYRTEDGKRFSRAVDFVHSYIEKIIKQRRQERRERNTAYREEIDSVEFKHRGNKYLDFLDIVIQTKDEDGKGLTEKEIQDEVGTFLAAGHDTTACGLTISLYNLAKYPDLQRRCQNEVLSVLGDKADVEWEDLPKLAYLTMFIKECMRLYPPAPAVGRYLKDPLQLEHSKTPEKVIPAGSLVSVSILCQHRNGDVWENPMIFDPERFTTENIAKRSAYAYIPFSAGSRNCIGRNFAMTELKVVLAQLLRRFQFYLDEDTPEPIFNYGAVLKSENGLVVKFKEIGH